MNALRLATRPRRVLTLAATSAAVLAAALLATPALAAEEFGIVPGSFTSGTFTSEGATGPLGENATPDTQAGDHPYEQNVSFKLITTGSGQPTGHPKEVRVELPPGFVGDPNATPRCLPGFLTQTGYCPSDTAIGTVRYSIYWGGLVETGTVPVFNMVTGPGELALFEFHNTNPSLNPAIHIHLRNTGDYGVTATASGISTTAAFLESTVTLWGVPADSSHDAYRGEHEPGPGCMYENGASSGSCPSDAPVAALLRNPTACDGSPLLSTLHVDSWQEPGVWHEAEAESPALSGCEKLVFDPSLEVIPETTQVDTPSGLHVDLHVPQNEDPYGLATPDLRNASVTMPVGMAVSPSGANGLEGCTPAEIGLHTENPVGCPTGSKLGVLHVTSPDLPEKAGGGEGELTGAVYLGEPASGPVTAPPYTIYLVAEGYGLSIRLQGSVSPNPTTGQLTTTFAENPPLPFDDLKLDFFGGPRAALMTPPVCGTYTTTSQLTPYSSSTAATPSSTFGTSFDGNGAGCPSPLPFGPSFNAGSTNTTAGGFGSFVLNVSRPDGQQALSGISVTMPPGLLGMLSSVSLCGEPQAAQGTCPEAANIGTATAGAGPGPEPFYASGPVYLTGPYKGAPFGLSVAIPAVAGPFNFGTVIVRSAIYVDPHTAQVTVQSDPLPQMVDTSQADSGVPVALQNLSVVINRPGFIFNPTSCNPMSVTGALSSNQGASDPVSSRFQVEGCQGLAFKPSFTVSTQAKTSKNEGASLDVKVASSPGQANIAKVDVALPLQLPSRLSTLQQACTEAQFATNPAGCPAGSIVGVASAVTPVLNVPLSGPAILVSHGGAAFPDLVVILQGQGVSVELTGETAIKKGITYSKFQTIPDAPVASFELKLPEGPHSILGAYLPASANGSLCGQSLTMPTSITGQNGAVVKQPTPIAVTGCPAAVKITKTVAKAKSVLVTVDTTVNGTVTLTGAGVKTTTRRNLKAGSTVILVPLTTAGRAMRSRHRRLQLRVSLTTGKHAVANTASVKL